MQNKYGLAKAIKLASMSMVMGVALLPFSASYAEEAMEAEEAIEEVISIGSAIKRKDLSSSMPVQQFSAQDIAETGALNAAELMQKLPAMQGFTTGADSVGGSGGGLVTADIHGIGESYTLVLVNGRRIAPSASDGTIDISHISTSMIKSVEVLTDGASALYGSDAIAGVVNFILKDEIDQVTVSARFDMPTESGGEASRFDITGGFGNRKEQGFSVVASFSHVEEKQLASVDRDFAKSGFITFNPSSDGDDRDVFFFNGSPNAIPGNATIDKLIVKQFKINDVNGVAPGEAGYINTTESRLDSAGNTIMTTTYLDFNPYKELSADDKCADANTPNGDWCYFDYTSTIEILPETTTDTAYLGVEFDITDNISGFSELTLSSRTLTSRIAPYPSGAVPLTVGSASYDYIKDIANGIDPSFLTSVEAGDSYTAPATLTAEDEANGVASASAGAYGVWRALPAGNRTDEWKSDAINFVIGAEGMVDNIDFSASLSHSMVSQDESYPTGWLKQAEFLAAIDAGMNIFKPIEDFSAADQALLDPAIFSGLWKQVDTTQTAVQANASMPVMDLSGGEAVVAAGFDFRKNTYEDTPSEGNLSGELLFLSADDPFDLERSQFGVFSEAYLPVTDAAEVTASVRFDSIGGVTSAGQKVSDSLNDVTYKLSGKFDLVEDVVALRGAIGTGFKAPSLLSIGIPTREFGVTSGTFECPFTAPDPRVSWCVQQTPEGQAQVYQKGNADLKPEQSTQWTFGAVITPTDGLTIVADIWNIKITDQIDTLTENQIFGDPVKYTDSFTTWTNSATGIDELAIIQSFINVGEAETRGIDYRIEQVVDLDLGTATFTLQGTRILEQDSSLYGSSLGKFGSDDAVVFEDLVRIAAKLEHGSFTHVASMNYQSGYTDQTQEVEYLDVNGEFTGEYLDYTGEIPSHTTFDYQGQFVTLEDQLKLTLGIDNITDKEPPLSLRVSGAGHQVGFDPRYFDARGRTVYFGAEFSF